MKSCTDRTSPPEHPRCVCIGIGGDMSGIAMVPVAKRKWPYGHTPIRVTYWDDIWADVHSTPLPSLIAPSPYRDTPGDVPDRLWPDEE